jgi:hypothetical protein
MTTTYRSSLASGLCKDGEAVIVHIVLFTPRSTLTPAERQDLADAFAAALNAIPSIRRARVGRRITHGRPYEDLMAVHYEYAAIIEFDDVPGLKAYLEHPAHTRLGSTFFAAFEHALMYDFMLGQDRELPPF